MIIKFQPILLKKLWGGNKLAKFYDSKEKKIGEIWGISAHKKQSNIILNGIYKGITFRKLYQSRKDLFGGLQTEEFPLLFKLIDTNDNLSIQVHPDNEYAEANEKSYGKSESWFILDTSKKNSAVLVGHVAKSKQQIVNHIHKKTISEILNKINVKPGDYFYIPSGTIHAILDGITLLEVSQSSDVTYRIYDYDRLEDGKQRDLHIEKAIDVLNVPDNFDIFNQITDYFTFNIKQNNFKSSTTSNVYGDYIYIVKGTGKINEVSVKKGDFLMVSSNQNYTLQGAFSYTLINISN